MPLKKENGKIIITYKLKLLIATDLCQLHYQILLEEMQEMHGMHGKKKH